MLRLVVNQLTYWDVTPQHHEQTAVEKLLCVVHIRLVDTCPVRPCQVRVDGASIRFPNIQNFALYNYRVRNADVEACQNHIVV